MFNENFYGSFVLVKEVIVVEIENMVFYSDGYVVELCVVVVKYVGVE